MLRYRHTQFGTALVFGLGTGAILCGWLGLTQMAPGTRIMALGTAAVLTVAAFIFASLTIELTDHALSWHFGPGLIRRRVPVVDIDRVRATKSRFTHGWGIHFTRQGWLYNVSGFGAVEVVLKSGKTFLLGSDEPQELCRAIRQAIAC